jgi:hypothetical protein
LVSHPTGFGSATEEFVRSADPNDAWAPPAPWTTTRAVRAVTDTDELPTVVAPPAALADEYIGWMEGGAYGCCEVTRDVLADGRVVVIGAHA